MSPSTLEPSLAELQQLGRIDYIVSDAATGRVYWSESLFERRKVPRRQYFSADEALAFVHPDDRVKYEILRDAAIADGRPFVLDLRVRKGDGTEYWEQLNAKPRYDEKGRYTGVLIVVGDISDSKSVADALHDREETYRALFNGIGDAILFVRDRKIVACNAAALNKFCCTREQLVGKTPSELSPERQPDGRLSAEGASEAREVIEQGNRRIFEWRHSRFDGSEFDAEVTFSKVDLSGEPCFFAVIRDISARKTTEYAFRSALDKFTTIFELSPVAMVVSEFGDSPDDSTILEINDAAERMAGIPREQLVGKTVGESTVYHDQAAQLELRRRLMSEHVVRDFPITLRRRDGAAVDTEVSGALFELEGARHLILLYRDVTAQRATERQISALNESLDVRVRQLRNIADNLPALVCYQDADGRFEFVNKTAQQWLAKSEGELLGRTVPEVMPADYVAATQEARDRRRQSPLRFERTMRHPDGEIRTTETTYIHDLDADGVLKGYYTLAVDITARKAAEAELKVAHDKFAKIFAMSPDAIVVMTIGGALGRERILDVNEAAERLFDLRRDEMIGKTVGSVMELSSDVALAREKLLKEGVTRDFAFSLRRADGSVRETELSMSRFDFGGELHGLIIVRDVTERIESERRIRDSNDARDASLRLLRAITDHLPVLITYQDGNGRFEFANKTAQEWLAKAESELLGKTVPDTMPADYVATVRPLRETILSGAKLPGGVMRLESTLRWPDEKTRTIEMTHVYDTDENGELLGYYALGVDVSDRKATEEQLRQSQRMEAVGKLTGGVAHDFNNLLAVILGNLELAQGKLQGREEEARRLLAPALRAADRGATLTRSLLAFARQQPLSPSVLNLTDMMRDVADLFRRTLPASIAIEFVGGAGLWKCEVDAGELQNALLNLVVNARDAMPEGGKLTIETGNVRFDHEYARTHEEVRAGQYVMIAVSDTGTGMPPEVIARAFEPFYTTKGIGHGTGLGLSMVYGFAKQSRGHVTIYSEVGHGTTVQLYLPRWIGNAEEPEARKQNTSMAANNETLLVVEDDEDMRFVAVTMLRSFGYTVLEASTGRAALEVLRGDAKLDLIVTDVVLSGDMNGKCVADEAGGLRPGMRILYMSGYTENAIVHHGRLDHGVNFIQKPFRKDDLAAKVREVLDAEP